MVYGIMIRLMVLIAVIFLPCLIDAADYLITAPNVFRTDVEEDVLISIFGEDGGSSLQIEVKLTLFNSDDIEVDSKTATVTAAQPKVVKFIVSKADLVADEEVPTCVLEVSSTDPLFSFTNRAPLLVTTKNQVVFIQTDKPIYTPDQEVKIRVISLNEKLKPTDRSVRLEVVTPRGAITERRDELTTDTGYLTHIFKFSTYPTFGIWNINVYYGPNNEWKSTVEFELREYVLPTFDVTVEGQKQILPSDTTISATVTARYVYNKDVRGTAQVKMSVIKDNTVVHTFPTIAKELNAFGKGSFNTDPVATLGEDWFSTLENGILWIEALVTETATGDRENATISAGKFVKQVYTFKRERTIGYFKKGTTFDIKIDLAYSDGAPGIGILTKIEAVGFNHADGFQTQLTRTSVFSLEKTSNNLGQVDFRVDVDQNTDEIEVVIKTLDSNYPPEANGDYTFTVYPIESPSQAYLQIRVPSGEIQVVDNFEAEVVKSGSADVFGLNYFVIVRGKIVQAWSDLSSALGSLKTIRLDITREMAPSARLVIYSIVGDELVVDSALLDIVDVCAGDLTIEPKDSTLTPGDSTVIKITADSGSRVALLGVDKAVYFLKDFHRLTKKKMFQRMETLDLGCGPGGGMNSLDVFESAGLLVISSTNTRRTDRREGYGCQTESQRRRRRAVNENQACYDEFKSDNDLCSACEDGFINIPGKTCEQRIKRFSKRKGILLPKDLGSPPDISTLDPIVAAFYNCCVAKAEERNLIFGRTTDNEVKIVNEEVSVRLRSYFPETWIFDDYNIPDHGNEISVSLPVPDSITNWILQASSVSTLMGMCVADEKQIEVFKYVFIALKMPYSIIKGEQIQIQATLFNYGTMDVPANVYMIGTENVCSESPPGERGPKHQLTVPQNNAVTTYFNILPMAVGNFDIEIKAFTNSQNDGIKKQILVVHEGVERYHSKVILIDPTGSRAGWSDDADTKQSDVPLDNELPFTPKTQSDPTQNVQVSTIELNIGDQNAIPGTEQCLVTFFGDVMSPYVSAVAGGLEPNELIALPMGCGEQSMMYMSASVYTMLYLTNNDILTKELESDAVNSIENGYKKMVEFQRTDGSFSAWGENRPASTWLTAYTIKVFYQVLQLNLFVDPNVLCEAFKFIETRYKDVNNVQNQGMFYEGNPVLHTDITGGISGENLMTAFVVTALTGYNPWNQPGSGLAGCNVNYQDKINKAVAYLEENFSSLSTNYHRAVVAYALHVVGSNMKDDAWTKVKEDALYDDALGIRHWLMASKALTVEATSYALLIAVLRNEIPYANGIVNWLTAHRDFRRGFSSTSDTAIALEALATYAMAVENNNVSMHCTLSAAGELGIPGNCYHEEVTIDNNVATLSQQIKCPVGGTLYILCTGYGIAQAQVEIIYNTPANTPGEKCAFFIYAEMLPVAGQCKDSEPDCVITNYVVDISVKYQRELNGKTDMAIVEVGLFTGFAPVQNSIDMLVSNKTLFSVEHYEILDRKVILYLETITSEIINLQFQVQRSFEVASYQSTSVTVYDYYFPEKRCTSFYNPYDKNAELRQLCIDETLCECAAGACPRCLWSVEELPDYDKLYTDMACGSETDYVYEVSIRSTVIENGFLTLSASVTNRLREGKDNFTDATEEKHGIRLFVMKSTCSDCNGFGIGQKYLIMGKDGLPYLDGAVTKYKYLLDSTSYIEKMPKKSENKDRFKLVRKVKMSLKDDGCA